MDPMTMMALASAAGAAGGGKSGKTSTTTSQQQNTNVASPVSQQSNIAFSPVLSAMTGGGVMPSGFGGLYGTSSQIPSSSANPSTSQSMTEGAGSVLPRSSPTGYAYGPGFGLYGSPFQTPQRGLLDNDFFMLAVIAGAVFWFTSQEG